ncbi:class I SAM-dependent methyltransferase [Parahaliea sp. F7430]|uniref:Class I SAM-dependent methyltransferase n=1 Tax=Sediminihaliea albiluteola TaxID=2758564 RepID=A0A7W2TTT2_9GAMM|nr:class I SAM-dependent methyltransferase [Sediminihaliea albiluteola]MBA6411796.1 class I SAM-dependent methyltransferase [Sediminihaliea albiluteola]
MLKDLLDKLEENSDIDAYSDLDSYRDLDPLTDLNFAADFDNYSTEPELFLDVPYVPTKESLVGEILDLAKVGPRDLLYDLGSGDGRIVVAAAKERGSRAVGIDLDPIRVADAMEYAGWSGVEYMVDFIEGSIFTEDISEATVVTLYLLDSVNLELRPRLLHTLRPGTRIVSHAFNMGDWAADERRSLSGATLYKWVVPAQIAGTWEWNRADGKTYRIELQQKFQKVSGSVYLDGEKAHLESAKLSGCRLELMLREHKTAPFDCFTLQYSDSRGGSELLSVTED